jgi:hypothetical protein
LTEEGLMLLQQLEMDLEAELPTFSLLTSSEKSMKRDFEPLCLRLELAQILKRFLPQMQETLSQLSSMECENER